MIKKGILVAAGAGSRLAPLSSSLTKHLFPIYDKPMIFYSLSILLLAGIRDISLVTKSKDLNVKTEIDGGINYETGKICIEAGADILVAGSFLFNQDNLTTATNNLIDASD